MKFRIDLMIFFLILLFFITNQIQIYAMIMFFAIIREFGHLVAGILLGMQPDKIEIKPFGVSIDFNVKQKDYNKKIKKGNLLELKKILIAIAGPFVNVLIIFVLTMPNLLRIQDVDRILMIFSNMALIIFNILPIYPLDGGRIVKGIIYLLKGKYIAEKYICRISYITLMILTTISSIMILYLKNIAIFLIIMFLWGLEIKEYKIYTNKKKLYAIINQEVESYEDKNIKIPIENKVN